MAVLIKAHLCNVTANASAYNRVWHNLISSCHSKYRFSSYIHMTSYIFPRSINIPTHKTHTHTHNIYAHFTLSAVVSDSLQIFVYWIWTCLPIQLQCCCCFFRVECTHFWISNQQRIFIFWLFTCWCCFSLASTNGIL